MKFEIGKVREYDGFTGTIVAPSGSYNFLSDDVTGEEPIAVADYVLFRGEVVNDIHRAHFVKFFSKDVTNINDNKNRLERLLTKDNGEE